MDCLVPASVRWLRENQGKHSCQCGCEAPIRLEARHFWRGVSQYVHGHQSRCGLGVEVARLDYRFTPVAGGTVYRNSLTLGSPGPAAARFLVNRFVRPRLFPEEMGEAWLRHNVEEVGNFEYFLPALYQQSQSASPETVAPASARDHA